MDGMRISELAARSGVPASTLRYYEAEGLLPARRADNGYRVYGATALDRLAFIAQAKHLDLPLQSVHELVEAWASEPCRGVRAKYRPMLVERIERVDERTISLRELRGTLAAAIERLDALPDRDAPCDPGCAFLDEDESVSSPGPALPVVESTAADPKTIACSLGAGDYADRRSQWHDVLAGAPLTEVDGGIRATIPIAEIENVAALAAAEQECCGFYAIRIDIHGSTFDLTITAPDEAASLLQDLVPSRRPSIR